MKNFHINRMLFKDNSNKNSDKIQIMRYHYNFIHINSYQWNFIYKINIL